MPLDATEIEQLKEAVKTDTLPDFLKPVADAGYKLYNDAQLDKYRGEVVNSKVSEAYTNVEAVVKEVSGIDKEQGEKATDYLKRAVAGMKTELTDLKQKAKEGTLSAFEKERLGQLETQLTTEKSNFQKERDSWQAERLGMRVSGDVDSALSAVKSRIKKEYQGDALADIVAARVGRFNNEYKAEIAKEGDKDILIYRDSKGETVNNENHKPANAAYILNALFAPYLETPINQQGSGSGGKGNEPQPGAKPTKDTYKPSAEVTTRVQLSDDLKRNGFAAGTEEYSELLKKFGNKADGTPLPLGR